MLGDATHHGALIIARANRQLQQFVRTLDLFGGDHLGHPKVHGLKIIEGGVRLLRLHIPQAQLGRIRPQFLALGRHLLVGHLFKQDGQVTQGLACRDEVASSGIPRQRRRSQRSGQLVRRPGQEWREYNGRIGRNLQGQIEDVRRALLI